MSERVRYNKQYLHMSRMPAPRHVKEKFLINIGIVNLKFRATYSKMKIIVVEDEIPAAEKLERLLIEYDPQNEIIGKARSIKKAIDLINAKEGEYDLIFMDIQLTDGKSFEIFNHANVSKPVIFLTAFDQYAIEAFKSNGIDYLLKPITFNSLQDSLKRYERLKEQFSKQTTDLNSLAKMLQEIPGKSYKERFLVKMG